MGILHQMLIEGWSRNTLICENVLGNLTPTPPRVEFWRLKIRIGYAGHRKMKKRPTLSLLNLNIFSFFNKLNIEINNKAVKDKDK